jgi:hypothetical protein
VAPAPHPTDPKTAAELVVDQRNARPSDRGGDPNLAGVVSMAGTTRRYEAVMFEHTKYILARSDATEDLATRIAKRQMAP